MTLRYDSSGIQWRVGHVQVACFWRAEDWALLWITVPRPWHSVIGIGPFRLGWHT